MKQTDLAWAAGIVDGEGCFLSAARTNNSSRYIRLCVVQADYNGKIAPMLTRLRKMFGGAIFNRYTKPPRKPAHIWAVSTKQARDAADKMWPYLGVVKRKQYRRALRETKP